MHLEREMNYSDKIHNNKSLFRISRDTSCTAGKNTVHCGRIKKPLYPERMSLLHSENGTNFCAVHMAFAGGVLHCKSPK